MRRLALPALLIAPMFTVFAAAPAPEATKPPEPVKAESVFTPTVAVIQGVVEGLTEYLPVSSTGHLILINSWLGLENENPVLDRDGTPVMLPAKVGLKDKIVAKLKGEPAPAPQPAAAYTLKEATDDYSIVIQFGAILAVLFAFRQRVTSTLAGVFRRERKSLLLARNLIVAFIPAAVLGLAFGKLIDTYLFNAYVVAGALFAGGLVMLWVEKRHLRLARNAPGVADPDLHELTLKQAATIGVCQCAALCPGTSRSMSTIVGGYLAGLSPARATEFSFLLGLITLTAASAYKGLKHGPQLVAAFPPATMLLGMAIAAVVAFATVKWMIGWITRHGLAAFAWYRFLLALFVLASVLA